MTTFEVTIDPKDAAGAVAVDKINQALLKALAVRMKTDKITRSDIAHRLGIDSSVLANCFKGNQNISARMVGEILWALGFDFDVVLHDATEGLGSLKSFRNVLMQSSIEPGQTVFHSRYRKHPTGSKFGNSYVRSFKKVLGGTA